MSAKQLLRVVLVPSCGDVKIGMALVKDSPQGTTLTGGPPAGLIHVHGMSRAQALEQIGMGI